MSGQWKYRNPLWGTSLGFVVPNLHAIDRIRPSHDYQYSTVDSSASSEKIKQERGRTTGPFDARLGWNARRYIPRRYYFAVLVATALLVIFLIPFRGAESHPHPLVNSKNGTWEGVHLASSNQDIFLGIPYAKPPIGPLRFRQSLPYDQTWSGARSAANYGFACPSYLFLLFIASHSKISRTQ